MSSVTAQWEYRLEVVKNPDVLHLGDRLSWLGSRGWELVSTMSTVKTWVNLSGNDLVFLSKRRGVGPFLEHPEDQPGYVPT